MSFIIVAAWLLKLILLIVIYNLLLRALPFKVWQRRWGFEAAYFVVIIFSYYSALAIVEAIDYIPYIGSWVAQAQLYALLGRFDLNAIGTSLGGLLLTEGIILVTLGVTYMLLFTRIWHLSYESQTTRLWTLILLWYGVRTANELVSEALGLPNPLTANYTEYYQAVAGLMMSRAGNWSVWLRPAATAGGTFALMSILAVMFNLGWGVARQAATGYGWDRLEPYEGRRRFRLLQTLGYFGVTVISLDSLTALMTLWKSDLKSVGSVIVPSQSIWLLFSLRLILTMAITWLFWRRSGPEYFGKVWQWNWSRLLEISLGWVLSFMLILAIALVENFFGWWRVMVFRWLPGNDLLAYYGLLSLNAIGVEVIFRGYLLQRLNTSFSFLAAAVISSSLFALTHVFNPGLTWIGLVVLGMVGILQCYLFHLSRSLWLPVAFNAGWNFFLGPVFNFPVSGLDLGGRLIIHWSEAPAWITGGAFGPEGGLMGLMAVLLGLAFIWVFVRLNEA